MIVIYTYIYLNSHHAEFIPQVVALLCQKNIELFALKFLSFCSNIAFFILMNANDHLSWKVLAHIASVLLHGKFLTSCIYFYEDEENILGEKF